MNKRKIVFGFVFNGTMLIVLSVGIGLFIFGLTTKNEYIPGIVGLFIIACLIAMSVEALIKRGRLSVFDWVSVSIYYVTAIAFVCAYLASIPNNSLREVMISVASATIGGLLTLMGVGITIKYSRIEKEEDEINKCKPRVFTISPKTWETVDKKTTREVVFEQWKSDLKKAKKDDKSYCINNVYLATSDLSMCVYDGIMVNDNVLWFDYGLVLQKDKDYQIEHNLRFKMKEKPTSVHLLLTDMLDNTYKTKVTFEIEESKTDRIIIITSVLSTEMFLKGNMFERNGK